MPVYFGNSFDSIAAQRAADERFGAERMDRSFSELLNVIQASKASKDRDRNFTFQEKQFQQEVEDRAASRGLVREGMQQRAQEFKASQGARATEDVARVAAWVWEQKQQAADRAATDAFRNRQLTLQEKLNERLTAPGVRQQELQAGTEQENASNVGYATSLNAQLDQMRQQAMDESAGMLRTFQAQKTKDSKGFLRKGLSGAELQQAMDTDPTLTAQLKASSDKWQTAMNALLSTATASGRVSVKKGANGALVVEPIQFRFSGATTSPSVAPAPGAAAITPAAAPTPPGYGVLRPDWMPAEPVAPVPIKLSSQPFYFGQTNPTGGPPATVTMNLAGQAVPAAPTNAYIPGRIYAGMRYVGGDPNLQTSWQRAR